MRIGIAHGSRLAARALSAALSEEAAHQLLWTVQDGSDTLRKIEQTTPDLLLLDIGIANPACIEIVRQLKSEVQRKTEPAILLVADRPEDQMFRIYEAMGLGALDVVSCPTFNHAGQVRGQQQLFAKLRTVGRLLGLAAVSRPLAPGLRETSPTGKLIAIGASTGGPQAIFDILSALPPGLHASVVLVQHVESEFSAGFASWLQQGTKLRVVLAKAGMRPELGTALLAASNDHLVMTGNRSFAYTSHPDVPYRPSVDALFRSLADHWSEPGTAVLLTGMGRDGAEGMKRLRQAGWNTIAQNEATSIVFGMPKAAIELGGAEHVLGLPDIAPAVIRMCR
ncbi:MAG TPA: chemotaxis-specific protein-glutamate methyltransferase CheB [Polyangiales bacterium]|nr:chemotaxis-specific protein-glutamate methyltransferase CheB [Polyangiales bacterium]